MASDDPYSIRAAASTIGEIAIDVDAHLATVRANPLNLVASEVRELERSALVVRHAQTVMQNADPQLLQLTLWDNVESAASDIRAQMESVASSEGNAPIAPMKSAADRLLDLLHAVPVAKVARRTSATGTASQEFLREIEALEDRAKLIVAQANTDAGVAVESAITSLHSQIATLTAQIDVLGTILASTQSAVDIAKAEASSSSQAFKEVADRETVRLTALTTDWTTRFQTALDKANSDMETLRDLDRERSRTDREASMASWTAAETGMIASLKDQITYFEGQHARVALILGVSAASASAGTYLEEAKEQKRQADFWRWASLIGFAGALVVALWQTRGLVGDLRGLSNAEIAALATIRVGVSAAALSGAAWLAAQVSQHRDRERDARRIASELTAFRPFIAELATQDDLIRAAVKRYFPGHSLSTHDPDPKPD